MRLAMIGLGKMGANMARRLRRHDIEVVGYNRSPQITETLAKEEGIIATKSLDEALGQLTAPRYVWLMLPAGDITEQTITTLQPKLSRGDIIIDGGNANYQDSMRRGAMLAEHGIGYIDAGTSGGVWGLDNGYCMMVGGEKAHVDALIPVLKALAPSDEHGWAHVGPVGAGHYTKMVHNGIEYGMMQSLAEGLSLLKHKPEFDLDLAQVAEVWRYSSVVRSWLLDLTAEFLARDQTLTHIAPYVSDSGEGRWTVIDGIQQGIATPVLALALHMRFASQDKDSYTNKLLAMMRNAFGGHQVKDS
ncbi:MAG: decarboxylating 6-phosphogluconate dehydrogenase [Gammaproteobacteria bacterium]|jgi:6-phosphogluconate dehydrogenase